MSMVIDGTNGLTFPDSSHQQTGIGYNRIINGAMVIDQRNAGASVSINGSFAVDRWSFGRDGGTVAVSRSTVAPAGFINSLLFSVTTGYSPTSAQQNNIRQFVEGFNVSDLGWGTANASTITLSFWVRSSLTGTFAGSLINSAYDRSYVFSYTIASANTWEQKTVTISGDTSGTWLTDNGTGIRVFFDMGSGSNYNATAGVWSAGEKRNVSGAVQPITTTGATFYITGVQLEKGSTATSFDYRPYGTELALCQRYFQTSYFGNAVGTATTSNQIQYTASSTFSYWSTNVFFQETMRAAPTVTSYSPVNGASGSLYSGSATVSAQTNAISPIGYQETVNNTSIAAGFNITFHYTASAEL
jgi:hypothetical protein